MDPRTPSPMDLLEELVTTLRASLMPVLSPPSASVSPMALPVTYSRLWRLPPPDCTVHRDATSNVPHRTLEGSVPHFSPFWSSATLGATWAKAHAIGLHQTPSCRAGSPPCGWTLLILCLLRTLHWNLPSPTLTPSGECCKFGTSHCIPILVDSATIHSRMLCFNPSLCRLGLLGELLLTKPSKPSSSARQVQEPRVETIQGKPLGRGQVQYWSPPVKLKIGTLHEEEITFLVLEGPTEDIILERPWLILHSPEIKWDSCDVTRWSEHCLSVLPRPLSRTFTTQVASTSSESPTSLDSSSIPPDYVAFQNVFSKQVATHLPPHRTCDLLPGVKLPKGRDYPLSIPEHKGGVHPGGS